MTGQKPPATPRPAAAPPAPPRPVPPQAVLPEAPPEPVFPRMTFEFRTVSHLANFLVTTQEEDELRPGNALYDQSLNQLFFKKPQTFFVRVQARRELMKRLIDMAESSKSRIHKGDEVPDDAAELDIQRMLRMLRLKPVKFVPKAGSLLLALWDADAEALCALTSELWNLGAGGLELAFLQRPANQSGPTHLIRIQGLRHMDALRSWQALHPRAFEIYSRNGRGVGETEFYVLAGYEFPVPSVERLARLAAGLVLIRPSFNAEGVDSGPAEWRAFDAGDVRFFRKPHEVLNLQVSREERAMIEVAGRTQAQPIPLSLAIIPKPRTAVRQARQIDQEIDRVRRSLRDLEQSRAKLVGRDRDEVYFAYRFNQSSDRELNPLLVRLLQQRLGTLAGYDYAYCQPQSGVAYHLVIANRPSRTLGFALQMADRVYYQPKQWQDWAVNLFLPMEAELAPLIDSKDAMPLLQSILDQSSENPDSDLKASHYREWAAFLWEPGPNGRIDETRVKEKVPLLSQFRLLNSFQCQVARDVSVQSRLKLAEGLREARAETSDELHEIERELLEHVCRRTDEIETKYVGMQTRLSEAEKLVTQLQPQVELVTGRLSQAPRDWIHFVQEVIRLHRDLSQPALNEFTQLQNSVIKVQTALLKTLTPRGRDLVAAARREVEHLHGRLQEFDDIKTSLIATLAELEQLGTRVEAVLVEVRQTYLRLEERLRQLHASEQEIITKQKEIDEIQAREAKVRVRLAAVQQQRAEAAVIEAETERRRADIRILEEQVMQQTVVLGQLKVALDRSGMQASARLGALALQVSKVREHSEAMERLSRDLNDQVGFVERHSAAVTMWETYRSSWERALLTTGNDLSLTVTKMEHVLSQTKLRSADLDELTEDVRRVSARVATITKQGHGHGQA